MGNVVEAEFVNALNRKLSLPQLLIGKKYGS